MIAHMYLREKKLRKAVLLHESIFLQKIKLK